jgi:hypothetical protein
MKFEHLPIIDMMIDFYQKPRDIARFKDYIQTLTGGDNNNLEMPIMGFNPMAKEHILEQLFSLKALNIEEIIEKTLSQINSEFREFEGEIFKVLLNLADDLKGGWTDYYTSDYQSKFQIKNLAKRKFCIPVFWSGESYNQENIKQNVLEYCYRTVYFTLNSVPETLEEHIKQEIFVAQKFNFPSTLTKQEFEFLNGFYQSNKNTTTLSTIINFFYGDAASEKLGYPLLGINTKMAGFEFAKILSQKA